MYIQLGMYWARVVTHWYDACLACATALSNVHHHTHTQKRCIHFCQVFACLLWSFSIVFEAWFGSTRLVLVSPGLTHLVSLVKWVT